MTIFHAGKLKITIYTNYYSPEGADFNFWHYSFITEIYIAPLQGYYSEALPTLARPKRTLNTTLTEHYLRCMIKSSLQSAVLL